MKRKYCIVILILFILSLITIFTLKIHLKKDSNVDNDIKYSIKLESLELNKYLDDNLFENISVDVRYVNDNNIYGLTLDTSKNGDLLETEILFKYNYKTNTYKQWVFEESKRVWDYYIFKDNIYVVILEHENDSNNYAWTVRKYDNGLNDYINLMNGVIENPLYSPKFLFSESLSKLYLATISNNNSNNDEIIQNYNFYEIVDDSLVPFVKDSGIRYKKEGKFLCNMFNLIIENDNLIFCQVEDYKYQNIISINLNSHDSEVLYRNEIKEWTVSSYIDKIGNNLLIIMNSLNENGIQRIIVKNTLESEIQSLNVKNLSFGNKILDNKILFHSYSDWYIYDIDHNKIFDVDFPSIYTYPKYYVLNDNEIFLEGNNFNFYLGTINTSK